MKKAIMILFIGIRLHGMAQTDSAVTNIHRGIPISDIVNTLSECNCMFMGMRGSLTEKEVKLASRSQAILFSRNFKELDSLFDYSNDLIKLYAFSGICVSYPDSITNKHLEILNKKERVKIYKQETDTFPSRPINEIAGIFYKRSLELKMKNHK